MGSAAGPRQPMIFLPILTMTGRSRKLSRYHRMCCRRFLLRHLTPERRTRPTVPWVGWRDDGYPNP